MGVLTSGAAEPDAPVRFSYARAVAPMMWVLLALSSIELVVLHLLVSAWRRDVALLLSVVTLAGIVWLVHAILSFRRMPVTLDDGVLTMRVGVIRTIAIPVDGIAAVGGERSAAASKLPGVLNLALIAHPNVHVDLRRPVHRGRRTITSVAHRLDDPAAFLAALDPFVAS
ncbi:MAG: hypothetical protein V4537_10395 [Pseudomonadota bacterium]